MLAESSTSLTLKQKKLNSKPASLFLEVLQRTCSSRDLTTEATRALKCQFFFLRTRHRAHGMTFLEESLKEKLGNRIRLKGITTTRLLAQFNCSLEAGSERAYPNTLGLNVTGACR
jgi:hypothetical protein